MKAAYRSSLLIGVALAITLIAQVPVPGPIVGGGGGGGTGATIPSTTNLISGNGSGNGADSGIVPSTVLTGSGTLSTCAKFTGGTALGNGGCTDNGTTYTITDTHFVVPATAGASPAVAGGLEYDTTQNRPVIFEFAQVNSVSRVICASGSPGGNGTANNMASSDGATYNTLVSNAAQVSAYYFNTSCVIPANMFIANKRLRATVGVNQTASAGAPSIVMTMKLGSTIVMQGTSSAGASSFTNNQGAMAWTLDGTAAASGSAAVEVSSLYSGTRINNISFVNTTYPAASVATNGALTLTIGVQYSAATAGNMMQLRSLFVEELN